MKESWDNLFGEVPASFEARIAETLASLEETPKVRRLRIPAGGLVAAVLTVVILGGTALATNLFGLRSLTVADPYATPDVSGDVIALQGDPESPEFLANAEWMDYLAGYDFDSLALGDTGTADASFARYSLYSVYAQDMADALDEITARHGLRLHTALKEFSSESALYDALGTKPFLSNCAAISGYVYEDGSFQGDGTAIAGKCYEYQLGRYVKGSFSEVTLNVGNADAYEEWLYTTASGVEMQLSMGADRCVLLADLPGSFVAINLLGGTDGNTIFMPEPVTRSDLETFAEFFDLSVLG